MHSHEKKETPAPFNLISYDSQKRIIQRLQQAIDIELRSYLPGNQLVPELAVVNLADLSNVDSSAEHKESKVLIDKIRFVHAIHNEFTQTTIEFRNQIEKKTIKENKLDITVYLKSIRGIFKNAETLICRLRPVDQDQLKKLLVNLDSQCLDELKYLDKIAEITIYQVNIPEEQYKNLIKNSEKFLYHGRAKSTVRAIAGVVLFAPALEWCALNSIFALPLLAYSRNAAERVQIAKSWVKPMGTTVQLITAHGYACRQDFPTEWIAGKVDINGDAVTLTTPNPNYLAQANCKTVYMLDGRPSEFVFKNGTSFFSHGCFGNPRGHVIYFHNPNDAFRCANLRVDGEKFDARSGWRLQNEWKEGERKFGMQYEDNLRYEIDSAFRFFSRDVVKIVCDYAVKPRSRFGK